MKNFDKRETTWLESIIFAFFFHVLLIFFILTTPVFHYLDVLSEKDSNKEDAPLRLLVDLQESPETKDIESFIISTNALEGSGQLTPDPETRVHLLGEFLPPSEGSTASPESSEQTSREDVAQRDSTPFSFPSPSSLQQKPPTPQEANKQRTTPSEKQLSSAQVISGLESENSTNFKFHLDKRNFQQPSISRDKEAALFLDIKKSLSYKMSVYANSRSSGVINYHYLKVGEVSALATVDRAGNMNFSKMIQSSDSQPYLDYLIEKIVNHEQAVQHFPTWFTNSSQDKIYFEITLSYKGPPLYQWWVSVQLLSQDPNAPHR